MSIRPRRPLSDRQRAVLKVILEETRHTGRESLSTGEVADAANISGNDRRGNMSIGSWSGTTSPALAVASTLTSLVRRGLLDTFDIYHLGYQKAEYALTDEGKQEAHNDL